jgi:hypothetical protein
MFIMVKISKTKSYFMVNMKHNIVLTLPLEIVNCIEI